MDRFGKKWRFMEKIDDIRKLPGLGAQEIYIWGVHLPAVKEKLDRLHTVLCPAEQQKAARFYRTADRQASIAARGALRVLLSGYTGIPPAELAFGHSENGKPFLDVPQAALPSNISFNISHSGEWVVLAIGRNRCIGVDIEQIRRGPDILAIASRYFSPGELERIQTAEDRHAAFFRLWSRKEAYIKACGSTLFRELSSFEVPSGDGEKEGWYFYELEAGSKYAAAVVTDHPAPHIPCYDFSKLNWW